MINHTITLAREYAEKQFNQNAKYQIKVNGFVKMFGLTKERAENFKGYYKNAIVEEMK